MPILRFFVRAATSVPIMWIDGQMLKELKWCSASHTASYPFWSMMSMRWNERW